MRRLAFSPEIQSAPLERMGTLLVGAAPVYAEDLRLALGTFGPRIWNGYGQGETPCTITAMGQRQMAAAAAAGDDVLLSSVGVPRLGIEVKIMQDDVEVSDGDIGEVCVRGETVMRGYLDRPEETAESLRGGWLHTGDLGRWERGHLQLLDRSKDMVISGGSNIYPREIEDRLLQEPTVAEVAVIGLPDPEWGERVVAIIVTAPGCTLDADRLDAFCLESMARYKRPKEYLQVDSLPRNGAGKVLKRELREQLQAKE
jgi:long-chain acyl-CoA synthetase